MTLATGLVAVLSFAIAGATYLTFIGLGDGIPNAIVRGRRANRLLFLGLTVIALEPAFILPTIGLPYIGVAALAPWSVYLVVLAERAPAPRFVA